MANVLGMSWISAGDFDLEAIEDLGLSQPDPTKPGSQASRTLRLNNTFQGTNSDYDVSSHGFDGTRTANGPNSGSTKQT